MKNNKSIKEQAARQAIPPVPPPDFIKEIVEETKPKREVKPDEDKIIAQGSESDFWKILKRFIENYQENLKKTTRELATAGSFDLEAIGMKYLLSDQIVGALENVVSFVENKKKVVELKKVEAEELEKKRTELLEKRRQEIEGR
jgi:hypothetical protein